LLEKDGESCRGETGVAVTKPPALWPCSLDCTGNGSHTAIVRLQEIELEGGAGTYLHCMCNTLVLGR